MEIMGMEKGATKNLLSLDVMMSNVDDSTLNLMDLYTEHWLLPEEYRIRDNSQFIRCLKRELQLCIEQDLSETERYCIQRYYFDNIYRNAIAIELGVQDSAVSKRMKIAEQKIRERLGLYMKIYKRIEHSVFSVYS